MLKGLTLSLWAGALACFVASWMTGERRFGAAGTTFLVCYIISAARLRRRAPAPDASG
jgi:hypothetical protein